MADQCYLAIDLGAESGRVMAGLFDGARVRLEEVHRFKNGPVQVAGTRRWNLVGLWQEILVGLTQAAAKYGDAVTSVGVDTWGVDYVLLSKTEELIGLPYNYRDPRTKGVMDTAFDRVSRADIFAQTGLQFMEINTLYQLIAMQQSAPELMKQVDCMLMVPDFFHWLLCGSRVVEFTNATTSQCYDASQRDWALDMLRKFDIPTSIFPDVVPPGTTLGPLRDEVARQTGLPRVDVVAPATHDTGAAIAAVPTERTGTASWAYISSGTWSLIGVEVQEAILTAEALEQNVTNEGGVDGTYRLLKNVMGLWLVQECRRSFEQAGQAFDYAALTRLAEEAEPFRSFVYPNDDVFLSPDDMPTAIQDWCKQHGEPIPQTPGALARCALESLALKYHSVVQGIESLTGEKVEVIHVVGGGSQNRLLNQFTANACGVPVVAGPTEATALGNVLIQARAAGQIGSLAEIREVVRRSEKIETVEPADTSQWQEAAKRFASLG